MAPTGAAIPRLRYISWPWFPGKEGGSWERGHPPRTVAPLQARRLPSQGSPSRWKQCYCWRARVRSNATATIRANPWASELARLLNVTMGIR
jgi:hypothetical protein